ncbi:hypothetical protein I79_004623 [Cricetulus griseus]|uniref:Uncharacterized protein n=1 Tax=Cricetulus griseus TaxID=10029 RepID=G3H317_CRIGR|nr:hypothetical protein I79_004623 [Cricetulus griseus]
MKLLPNNKINKLTFASPDPHWLNFFIPRYFRPHCEDSQGLVNERDCSQQGDVSCWICSSLSFFEMDFTEQPALALHLEPSAPECRNDWHALALNSLNWIPLLTVRQSG